MKRKTNLFYFTGDESNFLTFSNYTEHLTGNFLATDYKLFPSRYICLNIPLLNDSKNKEEFIKQYLAGYYENKLAFLRDKYAETGQNVDANILYLQYLFDTIDKYLNDNVDKLEEGLYSIAKVFNNIFIGNITEQNYNGSFTDIICTIEYANNHYYSLTKKTNDSINRIEYERGNELKYLYNWKENIINSNGETILNYIGPQNYKDVNSICDYINETETEKIFYYNIHTLYENVLTYNDKEQSNLEFNVIIPLYDIVNVNYKTNDTIIIEKSDLDIIASETDCVTNVPFGIWFANKTITLERDKQSGYMPSWSLLIGMQFKPFPNSNLLISDISNNVEQIIKPYSTFAEILNKQNNVMNLISKYNVIINDLDNKIKNIEKTVNKILDVEEINVLKNEMKELINKFNTVDDKILSAWISKKK